MPRQPVRTGADALARARRVVGAPFRLHGRDPSQGLDCVGLAAFAWDVPAPTGYRLRGGDPAGVAAVVDRLGLVPATRAPGAILLFRSGPGQLHLAIADDDGVIHADAALRRVVARSGPAPWPPLGAWTGER